jgi:microcystin-dependent protein
MTLYRWSQTAASNATADPSINWQEGQAPSSVNDSARAMMASLAKHRDDIAGAIVTGGTATAYTVTSYEAFDTLTRLSGQIIAFTPHVTNGGTVTLNVDSLGARPLRSAPGLGLQAGMLIQGTPYMAVYNNTDAAFYLHGCYGNPYNIPLLGGMDYWDTVAPNSSFIFPLGQPISRTVYAAAFARWGTTFGPGDGSTTFNVPNKAGRVSAMLDATGAVLNSATMTPDASAIGNKGGVQAITLATTEMPVHFHGAGISDTGHGHAVGGIVGTGNNGVQGGGTYSGVTSGTSTAANSNTTGVRVTSANGLDTTASAGGGNAHNNVQPTIVCNYIIRVL